MAGLKTSCRLTLTSILLLASFGGTARGADITLAWDPNADPAVIGYKLYWGTQSGKYTLLADVGNSTNEVVSDLQDGTTYYFAATAYDVQGNESVYSNEVSYRVSGALNPLEYFDTVQKMYIGYYHRPADLTGLLFWAGKLKAAGGNMTGIIEAFANSAEFQTLYGAVSAGTISTVVNGIYNALFGRDAEAEGLSYYVNGFSSGGRTTAEIMLDVLLGAQHEDLQSINNKLIAANLFTRTVDPILDGTNSQATYAGEGDALLGRNFLASVTSDPATIPTQDETTAYIRNNIADPGDPILK